MSSFSILLLAVALLGPGGEPVETLADLMDQPTWWAAEGLGDLEVAVREARWAEAAALAATQGKGATGEAVARLAFVEARARMELGTPVELASAATLFEGLAQGLAALSPRAWWAAAACRGSLGEVPAQLAALDRIPMEDPVLGEQASRMRCIVRVAAGQEGDDPVPVCQAHLDRFGADHEVSLALARGHLLAGRIPDAHQALIRVEVEVPTRSAATEASELRQTLEVAWKDLRRPLSQDERLERGARLYDAYRYNDALEVAREVLEEKPAEGSVTWCAAQLLGGRTRARQREQTKSMAWFDPYFERCDLTREPNPEEILFVAGRAAFQATKDHRCRAWLTRLTANHPASRYADDGLILLARLALRSDDVKTAQGHLERLVQGIGNGDMAPEGAWLLARILWDEGKYKDLIAWVDQAAPRFVKNTDYRSQGRLTYWRGRALQRLKRRGDARAAFEAVICAYPLSWYGLLSLERVEADKRGRGKKVLAGCVPGEAAVGPDGVPAAAVLEDPALARGLALARLGLADWSQEALLAAGASGASDAALMGKAALLHRAGAHVYAHDLIRRRLPRLLQTPPAGPSRFWWEVAYPRPFLDVVERHAKDRGLEPWLVYGIMREESGFNPRAESYAHALGLMQLLEKTARWMAEGTKIRVSRRRLRRPDTNVALGTKYLRYLFDNLKHSALSVGAYNCGKGGINKVRARVKTRRLDDFVERIPYDQTRRYTKRVLSSAAIYRHLYWGGWRPKFLEMKVPRKR